MHNCSWRNPFSLAVVPLGVLVMWGFMVLSWPAPSAAQTKATKKEEIEEGDEAPKKQPRRKMPKREEIEESDTKPDETQTVDLAAAATRATGEVRAFLIDLAVPHDDIVMRGGRIDHVEPLHMFIGPKPNFTGTFKPTRIEKNGKHIRLRFAIGKNDIRAVSHFERLVLNRVGEFLEKKDVPRLLAAEKALAFALRFHLTGRVRNPENIKQWEALENALRDKLVEVRLDRVAALGTSSKWQEAFDPIGR